MRDLRKKALLESGKTTSRKARSKETTPSSSRGTSLHASPRNSLQPSPRNSHANSANGSDDDSDFSDSTRWSTGSIDDLIAAEVDPDASPHVWTTNLQNRIDEICDRKRSSYEGRENAFAAFDVALTKHYAQAEIKSKVNDLLPAVIKSVKSETTEKETMYAIKALALMFITDPRDDLYEHSASTIKKVIADSQYPAAKVAAVHALGVATFYGGASEEDTHEVMAWLLDITSSDGSVIDELDNAIIVTAAMETWGFLATQLDDMEDVTEEAMDTFVEQLDSSDVQVQIAAGENIALLFEKSFTELESDDDVAENEVAVNGEGEKMVHRYTVYRQQHQLEQKLEAISKFSSKRMSKKDKKALHQAFKDVLNTVEKPTRGPRYSTALDEDGKEYGSRLKVTVQDGGKMTIDTWWKLHRLNALKRLLRSGFLEHYENNQVVFDTLPVAIE